MGPIESAQSGDDKFFKEAEPDDIRNSRSGDGDSPLAVAAKYGKLDCCKEIYKRCPELLYVYNKYSSTALHHAVWHGHDNVVPFLLQAAAETEKLKNGSSTSLQDIESGGKQEKVVHCKLLMMRDTRKQTALHSAVIRNHLSSAELLLNADPGKNLLRAADKDKDTAMHIAVRDRKVDMVRLLLDKDPAYVYLPNNSRLTPHLLALQEPSRGTITTSPDETRRLLFERQPEEWKKPIGENRWTMLHHATSSQNIDAIEDILEFSPDCANLADKIGQNFIHLAVKCEHEKLLRYILGSTKVNDKALNQQDLYGNTPFHIATSRSNPAMGLAMIYEDRVDKFIVNNQGKTALAAIKFEYDKRKAGVYGLIDKIDEKDLKDRSDFDLLVGALISTVSFTAGVTVPGGFFSDGPNQGNAVLCKKRSFEAFVLSNTIALALSLSAVFCHFCARRLIKTKSIRSQLTVATYCTLGAMSAMMVAFVTGSFAVLAVSVWLATGVCIICCCFFAFASGAMWRMLSEQREMRQSLA